MWYALCGTFLGIVLLAYALDHAFAWFDDPSEPPRVFHKIPLIGHLIGMSGKGTSYFTLVSMNTEHEMYTLGVFNMKFYVVNRQHLLPLAQKNKALSFKPFIQKSTKAFGDSTDKTHAAFGGALGDRFASSLRDALAPGPGLDDQNSRMAERVLVEFETLKKGGEVELLDWCRDLVVQATSCGVYGTRHPFQDPEIVSAFWTWEHKKHLHLIGGDVFGSGYVAREKVFEAFRKWALDFPPDVSYLVKSVRRVYEEGGLPFEDMYKQLSTIGGAAYPNSTPTLFWTILEVFTRPEVLDNVRKEVYSNAVIEDHILDVGALKTKCHLLLSVYQETQRTRTVHANIREVMEDTMLADKFVLKKGNYVQMPGQPVHLNPNTWGADAASFDPYRFCPKEGESRPKTMLSNFYSWGAPPHLCPARQFASTEILIIVSLLALNFDILPAAGELSTDMKLTYKKMTTLLQPEKDVRARMVPRAQARDDWQVKMGDSKTRITLASG